MCTSSNKMYGIKEITCIIVMNLQLIMCSGQLLFKDSKSQRNSKSAVPGQAHSNSLFSLHGNMTYGSNSGLTYNVSNNFDGGIIPDFGTKQPVLNVSKDGNWTRASNPGFTLNTEHNNPDNTLSQCQQDLWIPLFINNSEKKLHLEACFKFVILNSGITSENSGLVVNASLLTGFGHISTYNYAGNEIATSVPIWNNQSSQYWSFYIDIQKSDVESYYWSQLYLHLYINNWETNVKDENLRRFETKKHSSYDCKSEDTIMLQGDTRVAVVVKDLKYRAFWGDDSIFPDEDVTHCPSIFFEFVGIATLIGFIIVVTIVTIICKGVRQLCYMEAKNDGYRQFRRRLEP